MHLEKQIEFDKVKEMWCNLAVTQQAKDTIRGISFYLDEGVLRKQLKDTTNSKELLQKLGMPPLQSLDESKEGLKLAAKGGCLTPYQLERVEKALVMIRRVKDYLQRGKLFGNPLAYYEENLRARDDLREEIARQIRGGAVDDGATRELGQIRSQIMRCEEKMKQKAEQIMRANPEKMADSYCTLRNGRICIPVKKEYKLKIAGSVIDRSATGHTLFIEPSAVASYYEELQLLQIQEENEVYRILYVLSELVAGAAGELADTIALIEKLDFIFSKGKLSIDLDGTEPLLHMERRIVLQDARHPLMERKANVPLQFEIGAQVRGVVITGPNTGGKTVALKTVMLNCMMAQCGLHVTCKRAEVCMFDSYLCDIGDGQNLAQNLSTFSAHIKQVLAVLSEVGPDSLVILDELGSGTDPAEGMGIAVAILEQLQKSGALFLVTTHYPEVKEYAQRADHVINARMTFDRESLQPTYQMVIGEAGESCAFYIAERLGMPREMLKAAVAAAYGEPAAAKYPLWAETVNREKCRSGEKAVDDACGRNRDSQTAYKSRPRITTLPKQRKRMDLSRKYQRGDSVMVYPERKIGIVCQPVNEKGVLRVQLPDRKIWINQKRVKLHVAADALYPENYDFSTVFETVKNRKIRHDMERKYTEEVIVHEPMSEKF